MKVFKYIGFEKKEFEDLVLIILTLSFLFSFLFYKFNQNISLFGEFIKLILFISPLLFIQVILMKFYAYRNGFKLILHRFNIDRFWFNAWDRISYYVPRLKNGITSTTFAILLYILSFGFVVFASLFNFKTKQIPHLYTGTIQKFENYPTHRAVSNYRYSKALFVGFIYFFAFGFILKLICSIMGISFYNEYTFVFYYIAIFSTLPFPFTYGYDLYAKNPNAWITAISILFFSLLILLIFKNNVLIIWTFILSSIVIIITILWKMLMSN